MAFRVAHFSDLHLLDLEGAVPFRLFNKRATGYANIVLRRGAIHKPEPVFRAAELVSGLAVDHVVISGDVSNLALEKEFERVRTFISKLGLEPCDITIVPGNHDAYTHGAFRSDRFHRFFSAHLRSDIALGDAVFPVVKLRSNLAIVGISTAVPRPPFVAAGEIGPPQLERLRQALAHPDVRQKNLLIVQHHPPHNPAGMLKAYVEGLRDAHREVELLSHANDVIVAHGHLHRRIRRRLGPRLEAIGATSASLLDGRPAKTAGFNLYSFDQAGMLTDAETYRFESGSFVSSPIRLASPSES